LIDLEVLLNLNIYLVKLNIYAKRNNYAKKLIRRFHS